MPARFHDNHARGSDIHAEHLNHAWFMALATQARQHHADAAAFQFQQRRRPKIKSAPGHGAAPANTLAIR